MIILSIPYQNDKFVKEALIEYYNSIQLYELRLDFLDNPLNFNEQFVNLQTILTIRDPEEGGKTLINLDEKANLFNNMIAKYDCKVDFELYKYNNQIKQPNNLILSYHETAHNRRSIQEILDYSKHFNYSILKIVKEEPDWKSYLEDCKKLSTFKKPVIFIASGFLSIVSRFLYKKMGFIGTYVGYPGQHTAENQLTIKEALDFKLQRITSDTMIGGLIGGDQVSKSLGLYYYNNYFSKANLNAAYLPFHLKNINSFVDIINSDLLNIYGFSITMPYKKQIPKLMKNKSISNLYIKHENTFYNSDKIAMEKAILSLKLDSNDHILVIGSGSTAAIVLDCLSEYNNLFITARNSSSINTNLKKYDTKFIPPKKLIDYHFNLIINCTPLGMNQENIFETFPLKKIDKVIDLPYSSKVTPLIEYCKKKLIPYIDGKKFWQLQSEFQLKKFNESIKHYKSSKI